LASSFRHRPSLPQVLWSGPWCVVQSCVVPTGESPVPVSAEAPASRVRQRAERPSAERTVKSPFYGEAKMRAATLVNAEQASSDYQPKGVWECRAVHVAAKTMHSAFASDQALVLPGVLAAARIEGSTRNTRDPTRRASSGGSRAYKAGAEIARCREGVRGARSTGDRRDKRREGRRPALVSLVMKVSARACP